MAGKANKTFSKISPEFSRLIEKAVKAKGDLSETEKDVKDYVKLIMTIAKPYVRNRVEYEDLIMAGAIGLLRARRDYKPERSPNFKAYATLCILGEIYSYCQSNANLITVPTHIAKASSYIDKIYKVIRATLGDSLSEEEADEIALLLESPLESKLTDAAVKKIRYSKERVLSIAKNSNLTYEQIAIQAKRALVSTVSEAALAGYQVPSTSVENKAGESELQKLLLESLGPKRYMVLKLHYQGYSNPEISNLLFEAGYTNFSGKPISRSAVKSLLDNAMAAIKNMEIFKSSKE